MLAAHPPFYRRFRLAGRIRGPGAMLIVIIAAMGAAAMAFGLAAHYAAPASPYYDHDTEIDWYTTNGTALAVTGGVNVTQGSTFAVSVTLTCAAGVTDCPDAGVIGFQSDQGLGNWPPHVAPCGWFRSSYDLTGSNLPQTLGPGGSVVVTLIFQAPVVNYPNASFVLTPFNETGWLDVSLTVGH